MRYFCYNEYISDDQSELIIKSEEQILKEYFPYWKKRMEDRFGVDDPRITEAECLDEWIVVNWAWEVND